MNNLPHPFDTAIRNRHVLGWSSRVAHLSSRQLRMARLEGDIADSMAAVQRRRITRTEMLSLAYENATHPKVLDASPGTSAVSMLLDMYDDVWRT